MNITRILYRGSLSSCNYACSYCPFAKTSNTRAELSKDRDQLTRFVEWTAANKRPLGILFTPWGEALIHRCYREALNRLSHLPHVKRVAIQTNLSAKLDELSCARVERLRIWATFHPGETDVERFLMRCESLARMGIRFSVGLVGYREHFDAIAALRDQLPEQVYLWINAPKSGGVEYSAQELRFLTSIDPYFRWNLQYWPSQGKACQTGWTSFTVDGEGDVRRCHFVDSIIGNLYRDNIWDRLGRQTCPNRTCGCHIGYVYRDEFQLERLYGDNLLERIPAGWPQQNREMTKPPSGVELPVVEAADW